MGIGYCIKCKKKVALLEGKLAYYKNGTPVEKGMCSVCGSKVARIYSKAEREELKRHGVPIEERQEDGLHSDK